MHGRKNIKFIFSVQIRLIINHTLNKINVDMLPKGQQNTALRFYFSDNCALVGTNRMKSEWYIYMYYIILYNYIIYNLLLNIVYQEDDGQLCLKHVAICEEKYRGADKSVARPGRKQASATEDFDVHISYL